MINLAEWLERVSIYKILRKEIFFIGFKEFESRVRRDSAFAAKFKGINDPAAVIALAKKEGYNLSMSDFSEELSDEELDNVAGGAGKLHTAAQFKKGYIGKHQRRG